MFRRSTIGTFTVALLACALLPRELCLFGVVILLLAASIVDFRTCRIPDTLTLPLIILAGTSAPIEPDARVLGLGLAPLLLWLVRALFLKVKGYHGLGLGDVKLMASCGALVGVGQVGLLIFSSAALALLTIMTDRSFRLFKKAGQCRPPLMLQPIAFGPFIVCATLMVLVLQQEGLLS
jgi:prepilin signal peptidase PulO-like enzyme (type II secretory pathway)